MRTRCRYEVTTCFTLTARPHVIARIIARSLLLALTICLAHTPSNAATSRVGFLSPTTSEASASVLAALREGLREHGYEEGVHFIIEARYANDQFDRLPDLARELVGLPVDLLVAFVTQASIAAKQATTTIPIVMIGTSDPVASGLVISLSSPGTNVTGTSGSFAEMSGKRLELLKEAVPDIQTVAVLWNPSNPAFQAQVLDATRASARALGIELRLFGANDRISIERAFDAIAKSRAPALNVLPDPVFAANYALISALAIKARLPSVTANGAYVDAGGLMAYGPDIPGLARHAAGYVARILKGAKPAELAVEAPTQFEFVINLKTATYIGLNIPPALRLRASRLIE